jgi:hypothetical protein
MCAAPVLILFVALTAAAPAAAQRASDDDIKRQMIADSITGYRGSCPCPENRMKNGRSLWRAQRV